VAQRDGVRGRKGGVAWDDDMCLSHRAWLLFSAFPASTTAPPSCTSI
jgi:hypothetical protein